MSAGSLDGVANAVSRRSWSRVVAFVLVFVMVASALAIVTTPARASSRPRIGLPEAMPDYMKFIVVNNFRFDPLAAMPTMPTSLQYNSLPRNQPLYYLAQFNGPVTPLMKAQLTATGATILYYIPYNAFIVRADGLTMDHVSALASIRWTGVFEPAYKLSPRLSDDYDLLAQRALDRSLPGSSATSIATGNSMRSFSSDLAATGPRTSPRTADNLDQRSTAVSLDRLGSSDSRSSVSRISLEITAFEPSRLSEILPAVSSGRMQRPRRWNQSRHAHVGINRRRRWRLACVQRRRERIERYDRSARRPGIRRVPGDARPLRGWQLDQFQLRHRPLADGPESKLLDPLR